MKRLHALAVALMLCLGACSIQAPAPGSVIVTRPDAQIANKSPEEHAVKVPVDPAGVDSLWERIRLQLDWAVPDNDAVRRARDRYLGQPDYLTLLAPRAQRYLHHIVEAVEARGLPMELALLPVVESALNPVARSGRRAAGLWQFIPSTAYHLGMRIDYWADERLDLRVSTDVALDYLTALNEEFEGDWYLALAAYNAGKGRVARILGEARAAGRPTNYWALPLPRETRAYLPRLLALASLISHPERYGLTLPHVANQSPFAVVDTGGQIELLRVARLAGIELRQLRSFNPAILRWATPPTPPHELLVPRDRAGALAPLLAALPDSERVQWQQYRIRRGDTLGAIARRLDTDVALLQSVNNIRGHLIVAGNVLVVPDGEGWRESLALAEASVKTRQRGYRVRAGDSLYLIASRFDVSIADIIDWNSLDPAAYLQPGQRLTLYVPEG